MELLTVESFADRREAECHLGTPTPAGPSSCAGQWNAPPPVAGTIMRVSRRQGRPLDPQGRAVGEPRVELPL